MHIVFNGLARSFFPVSGRAAQRQCRSQGQPSPWVPLISLFAKATPIAKKRAWRQSFKKNMKLAEYEDWDYVKYPKLRSFTWRQY